MAYRFGLKWNDSFHEIRKKISRFNKFHKPKFEYKFSKFIDKLVKTGRLDEILSEIIEISIGN